MSQAASQATSGVTYSGGGNEGRNSISPWLLIAAAILIVFLILPKTKGK